MKTGGLWIFLGCCVLAGAIFGAGREIADQIPERTDIPKTLYITTNEQEKPKEFGDYLDISEAAEYLNLSYESIEELIESGEWVHIAYPVESPVTGHVQYIISKTAVQEWVEAKLRGE